MCWAPSLFRAVQYSQRVQPARLRVTPAGATGAGGSGGSAAGAASSSSTSSLGESLSLLHELADAVLHTSVNKVMASVSPETTIPGMLRQQQAVLWLC